LDFAIAMKTLTQLVTLATAATVLATVQSPLQDQDVLVPAEQYLIEIEPGNTQWVTEEEKWELRRVCTIAKCKPNTDVNEH